MRSVHLSRRRFGQVAVAGTALAFGAHSASAQTDADASPTSASNGVQPDGTWQFTDDLGVTVTLPAIPAKIAADLNAAAPLWDFGIKPIAVSGWTVATEASWGNVDPETPVVNAADGLPEPDIESLLALGSEVFVTIAWAEDDIWSFTTPEAYEQTRSRVPVIAISVAGSADKNMLRFEELALALGADLSTPEMTAAKEAFAASVESFKALTAEKADVASFFAAISTAEANWSAAFPADWADLMWYQQLGMNIVSPDIEPGEWWETVSHEEAGKYTFDVLFNFARAGISTAEELQADPLFGSLPAIAAGQIGLWNQDFILSYQGMTDALETMAATLSASEKVT